MGKKSPQHPQTRCKCSVPALVTVKPVKKRK